MSAVGDYYELLSVLLQMFEVITSSYRRVAMFKVKLYVSLQIKARTSKHWPQISFNLAHRSFQPTPHSNIHSTTHIHLKNQTHVYNQLNLNHFIREHPQPSLGEPPKIKKSHSSYLHEWVRTVSKINKSIREQSMTFMWRRWMEKKIYEWVWKRATWKFDKKFEFNCLLIKDLNEGIKGIRGELNYDIQWWCEWFFVHHVWQCGC